MSRVKKFLKEAFFLVVSPFAPPTSGASILMYHSVGGAHEQFTVASRDFDRQMAFVRSRATRTALISELVAALEEGKPVDGWVCITFDDGYADNYAYAFPLLKKHGLRASFFITTGPADDRSPSVLGRLPRLTEDQIREMSRSARAEFLPHGHHHAKLDRLSRADAELEIVSSLEAVEKLVGPVPRIYAYASGRYVPETMGILAERGFTAAVSVRPGMTRSLADRYALPRNGVDASTGWNAFRAAVTGQIEWYERMKLHARSRASAASLAIAKP